MKEATGELNLTAFIVMAVAILVAFFYYIIWPMMQKSQTHTASCSKAICLKENYNSENNTVTCYEKGYSIDDAEHTFTCAWKG